MRARSGRRREASGAPLRHAINNPSHFSVVSLPQVWPTSHTLHLYFAVRNVGVKRFRATRCLILESVAARQQKLRSSHSGVLLSANAGRVTKGQGCTPPFPSLHRRKFGFRRGLPGRTAASCLNTRPWHFTMLHLPYPQNRRSASWASQRRSWFSR